MEPASASDWSCRLCGGPNPTETARRHHEIWHWVDDNPDTD